MPQRRPTIGGTLAGLPRLYRLDVVLISFFSYVVGALIAGGFDLADVAMAAGVTLLPMNFVYSLNAWSDRRIDAINKPHRPIPSGQVTPRAALIYSLGLGAGSLVLPLFEYRNIPTLLLFWSLPLLGAAYSVPPVRLKRFPAAAVVTTSLILVVPIAAGHFMNTDDTGNIGFFAVLLAFCLAVIPLKDIEDEAGDVAEDCGGNWAARLGTRRLMGLSAAGLVVDIGLGLVVPMDAALRPYPLAFCASALVLVGLFVRLGWPAHRLYRSIIRVIIVQGVLIFVLLKTGVRWPWL